MLYNCPCFRGISEAALSVLSGGFAMDWTRPTEIDDFKILGNL